jgi:tetratricopeptide (TPR) repeat protein
LSDTGEIRETAIAAAASGEAEECRLRLECGDLPDHERARLNCRLSEALYHRQNFAEALECARTAFDLQPESDEVANLCAWVFSNCGRHEEAAAAYERILALRPQWAEGHRHASGSFAAAGRLDRAVIHGSRASDLDPTSFEFAFHSGCLLEAAERHSQAIDYLMRATALDPADVRVLRHLSAALYALEQTEQAVTFALRAVALAPTDRHCSLHATELLLRAERYDEAAAIILDAVNTHGDDPIALRLLSAVQMLRARTEDALDAIDRALRVAPETAEYHLHRANLLYRLGRLDEAAMAFGVAAALDPSNGDARRADPNLVFLFGNFLCPGNDARLGTRHPGLEPDIARGRLVSCELLC